MRGQASRQTARCWKKYDDTQKKKSLSLLLDFFLLLYNIFKSFLIFIYIFFFWSEGTWYRYIIVVLPIIILKVYSSDAVPNKSTRIQYTLLFIIINIIIDRFYMALFSALEQTHCAFVACKSEWVTVALYSAFSISTEVVCLHRCLVVTWLVPRETAAVSARSVYTIQPCTMTRHFMQSHVCMVHTCLAVTCHLHFGQNALPGSFTCYCGNTGVERIPQ